MFYAGWVDPRPAEYRKRVNTLVVSDLTDCARWGLHLSTEENAFLIARNPDTLGHDDQEIASMYWRLFIGDPASKPYRIQEHI
jgi:hypothetical protein